MKWYEMDEYVRQLVADYAIDHLDKSDPTPAFDTYIVWQCRILGHKKWLISTTLSDGMYYEVTYNSAKREFYLDAYKKFEYKKFENRCIKEA